MFGPTHYTYTDGDAEVIETDSANGGLLASDPYQVPMEEQYAWLELHRRRRRRARLRSG